MIRWSLYLAAAALCGGTAYAGNAATLGAPCVPGSLQSYIDLNPAGGCSIGIEEFSAFNFNSSANAPFTTNDIFLTPTTGGFTFTQVSGAPCAGSNAPCFEELAAQIDIYDIFYKFAIDPGPQSSSADLGMDPPFGNVTINQFYCAGRGLVLGTLAGIPTCVTPGQHGAQELTVNDTNPPFSWNTGSVPLNPRIDNFADVLTQIILNGTNGPAGFDSVTGDTNLTPEPSTFLIGATLLAAGILIRRRFA
ncbi:MAG TPA: hypothetical protein VKB79_12105 [Bryobacteraceae bacterium]|nr:hypothetical protein [Bryobacteraceae bacterium]